MAIQDRPTNWNRKVNRFTSGIALAVGIAGLVGAFTAISDVGRILSPSSPRPVIQAEPEMDEIRQRLTLLAREQQVISRALAQSPENLQTRLVFERIQSLERRHTQIERAIMGNPARALELPLLRKDLDNARETSVQSLTAIKASVDQVYDLNKWLLGGMAIGILALAIGNFLTKKDGAAGK